MKTRITNTPIGKITSFENDSFTNQLKSMGYYAEQTILDNNLKPIIEKSNLILDIGGHVGYHSIAYCKYNPNATIMTFEPQSNVFTLLKENVELNGLSDRIQIFNLAVGDKNRETSLSSRISDGPNTNLEIEYGTNKAFNLGGVCIGMDGEKISMVTIDSLNLTGLDYLKIDVEGAEHLVLMGGEKTIKKYKPVICFEYNHKTISDEYVKMIGYEKLSSPFDILKSYGYTKIESIPYENFIATI